MPVMYCFLGYLAIGVLYTTFVVKSDEHAIESAKPRLSQKNLQSLDVLGEYRPVVIFASFTLFWPISVVSNILDFFFPDGKK
jgi:hypothetical protein